MTRKLRTNGRFNYGSLEPRQLLASVSLESGLLKIVGTSGDDEVQLEIVDDDNVRVLDDDVDIETFARSEIISIEFFGLEGIDVRYGNGGADYLDGGAVQTDVLIGGTANDTSVVLIDGESERDTFADSTETFDEVFEIELLS